MNRDMVFVSHANPEDNEFTRWLALQLAKDGYGVWCDLTKLLGGENFWKDAEEAIRTRTIKFIYVLSRTSNVKDGPRNELQIAKNVARQDNSLHNFVIPLHIDNLPHSEINVLLTSTNAVPFDKSWARGYTQLLEVLEREQVPKKRNFNAAAVTSWWREQFSAERGLKREPDTYLSNLIPILSMPQSLWLHTLAPTRTGRAVEPEHRLPFAGFMDSLDVVTFACADDIQPALGSSVSIHGSMTLSVPDLIQGKAHLESKKGRYLLSRLLRECWERWIGATGLRMYSLSNRAQCYFFTSGHQPNLYIPFMTPNGKPARRSVLGFATQADGSKRYWHYGVQGRPVFAPCLAYLVSAHVIFTSDGATPWPNPRKMHTARRRQCKSWFNPEWRDRLLATLHWLSQGNSGLCIPVGKDLCIQLSLTPEQFESEISYADPPTRKERMLLANADQPDSDTNEEDEATETQDDEDDEEDSEDGPEEEES